MEKQIYKKQVKLLLDVLPHIAKEKSFVLHGGTAINLFVRNMPRLSVDIDLTYIFIQNREETLSNIENALQNIKKRLEYIFPNIQIKHRSDAAKLLIGLKETTIKVEVNTVGRGLLLPSKILPVCEKAQKDYDVFYEIPIMDMGQLYGGKICAALDRQHPRDLFDIKYLLMNEGFSENIKNGFLLGLLSSVRPINEMLNPNFQNQTAAMNNQFEGMTPESFSYQEFEQTRKNLVQTIQKSLTQEDKEFLLNFEQTKPNWDLYDFQKFPAVQWKLQNIEKLKDINPKKNLQQYQALEKILAR